MVKKTLENFKLSMEWPSGKPKPNPFKCWKTAGDQVRADKDNKQEQNMVNNGEVNLRINKTHAWL